MKISQDELNKLCFLFHKWFRIADCGGSANVWNAIVELEEGRYEQAMNESLKEIGIEVVMKDGRIQKTNIKRVGER